MSKKMTQYTTKNLKWIHDPAHSWLKAPLNWLIDFGLINEISGYSYIDNPIESAIEFVIEEQTGAKIDLTPENGQITQPSQ